MNEFGKLNILKPQLFSYAEEILAIKNTMTIDYYFGHDEVLEDFNKNFSNCKPWISDHLSFLKSLDRNDLGNEVEQAKPNSLLMSPIMLTGECNANCEICYTGRKKKDNELKWIEIKEIIDQTKKLGSRTIYIAGEGEPTLDKSILNIFEYANEIDMDILLFTNGLILSNDTLCYQRHGISSAEFIKRMQNSRVYIYYKFWSTDENTNKKLLGLPYNFNYPYVSFSVNGISISIPKGLSLLLEMLPVENIGVESCVESRTADDIFNNIIPFIETTGVKSYIEPLIHSGKNFNNFVFDPSPEQYNRLKHWLVRQGCTRVAYIFVVQNNGYASPGISILSKNLKYVEDCEGLNIRTTDGRIKDLFLLRHTHPVLVKNRYRISGCLCEEFNLEMAKQLTMENA